MTETLPIVLVPGLACTSRLYEDQLPALRQFGPVTIADHRQDDTIAAIARRILAAAPPRFALAGLSMGGYIAFEILRQQADRVVKLALLDTTARADTPAQIERRQAQMALAETGRFAEVPGQLIPLLFRSARRNDEGLQRLVHLMAEETGPVAFVRQQRAIMGRADSRSTFAAVRCSTLVLVGEEDQLTPPERSREIADGIVGARLVVVSECGHLSTLEQPQRVTDALVSWLRD